MRAGRLAALALALGALAPSSAAALETRTLRAEEPSARSCSERERSPQAAGVARERWRAPAAGYLSLRLGGDAEAPDWDLAAFADGATAASTNSGSLEQANLWVRRGERVSIQACRLAGPERSLPLEIDLQRTALPEPSGKRISLESVALSEPGDVAELDELGIDVTHDIASDSATVVLYSGAERRALARRGYETETLTRDLAASDAAHLRREADPRRDRRSALPSARDSYRQYAEYTEEMKALAAEHPDRARSIVIGTSLEGRPIEGIEIATGVSRADDGRPVFLNLGLHHAREWPSGEFPLEFAIDLVNGYDSDPTVRTILDRTRVVIVPVVNPDGFVASRSYGTTPADNLGSDATLPLIINDQAAYKRKNCRPTVPEQAAQPCATRTNSGVDLNRNYGAYWGGPGASTDPTTQSYRGSGPFSEPESQAVRDFSASIHPTVVISNHTFTEGRWLRQPGFDADFLAQTNLGQAYDDQCGMGKMGAITPDEPAMKALGDAMAAANEPDWTSELAYETLCDITGATEDWNYFNQGAYGYTPEARGSNFHGAYASMVAGEYVGNDGDATDADGMRGAFLAAALEAGEPRSHGVISGSAPPGATLRLRKDIETPTCENAACKKGDGAALSDRLESTLKVSDSGTYSWHVNPSGRPLHPNEKWAMTCKQAGQDRSEPQQVSVARGASAIADFTGLCGGADQGGSAAKCRGKVATIVGTKRGESLLGTNGRDVIAARGGADEIRAKRGKDLVCGGGGSDRLRGAKGRDTLFGNAGRDRIAGGPGRDKLLGGPGADRLRGGGGRDRCLRAGKRDTKRSC